MSGVFDSWNNDPAGRRPPVRHGGDDRRDTAGQPPSASPTVESSPAAEAEAAGLRHWSEPPDIAARAGSTDSGLRGPTWRDEDPNWSGSELSDVFGEGIALGAPRPLAGDTGHLPGRDSGRIVGRRLDVEQYRTEATSSTTPTPAPSPAPSPQIPVHGSSQLSGDRGASIGGLGPSTPARPQYTNPQSSLLSPEPQVVSESSPGGQSRSMPAPVGSGVPQFGSDEFAMPSEQPQDNGLPLGEGQQIGHIGVDAMVEAAPKSNSALSQRVVVGAVLVLLVLGAVVAGPIPALVLLCGAVLMASVELFGAMRQAGLKPATLLGIVGSVALPAAVYVRGEAAYPLVVALTVIFGMLWYLAGADDERPVLNFGITVMAVLWVGGLAGFGALLLSADGGIGILVSVVAVTAASDSLAYFGGKTYGSRPFHPASPNKTWEGTLTGFFGAVFVGLVIGITGVVEAFDGELAAAILFGAVVGILAVVGDLSESLIKRDLGVKDMGTVLPGHGGVFDRIDALLFALPGAYYISVFFQLI